MLYLGETMKKYKLKYNYSYIPLVFFAVFFFPIALMLLLTGCTFQSNDVSYTVQYGGSRFWLGFWTLFFFPIAFILLIVNEFGVEVHTNNTHQA